MPTTSIRRQAFNLKPEKQPLPDFEKLEKLPLAMKCEVSKG